MVRVISKAFTLIELLVVIGIIAVLIGILVPTLALAQAQARSIVCQSNLRQWGQAVLAYAHENDCWLPRRGQGVQKVTVINRPTDWFNALPNLFRQQSYQERYTAGKPPLPGDGSVWWCPDFVVSDPSPYQFSYAMNMKLSTWNNISPDKINRIGQTSSLVFMSDASGPFASTLPAPATAAYNPVGRHRKRVNIAFLDGHVSSFPAKDIGVGVGDQLLSDVVWTPKHSTWAGPNP